MLESSLTQLPMLGAMADFKFPTKETLEQVGTPAHILIGELRSVNNMYVCMFVCMYV